MRMATRPAFGSVVCVAGPDDYARWDCPNESDPNRYDSPHLFRHGDEIYVIARRDIDGPFDLGRDDLTFEQRKGFYLVEYSLRPKRTALYRLDQAERRLVHLRDLPGFGDTAFPSVRRVGPHEFLVANYTSPVGGDVDPNIAWIRGQAHERGTHVYLLRLRFVPQDDELLRRTR